MPAALPARPLVVTGDPLLLDDVLRLAAAAGTVPEVVADAGAARRSWSSAPVVLVGADQVAAALRAQLPRRAGVVLLGADLDDGGVWQRAVGLGAEHVWFLPDHEAEVTTALADARDGAADLAPLLAVVGGRGGAGATTLWYVVHGKVQGMGQEDFLKVGELIRTYGTPGKFYRYTNLYLINPEGTHKVWCMWSDDPDGDHVHGINLARTDRSYGPQTFSASDVARVERLRLPPVG